MWNHTNVSGVLINYIRLEKTEEGLPYVSFRIACNRDYKADKGKSDIIPCIAYGENAKFLCKYFTKDSRVTVSGRLESYVIQEDNDNRRLGLHLRIGTIQFGIKENEYSPELSSIPADDNAESNAAD